MSTAQHITDKTRITKDDVVLEIGCGAGRIGDKLAPRCAQWIGADVSANMLAHAKALMRAHDNTAFVLLNGFDLRGIEDASVDVVYCSAVFMHLDEWDRFRYVKEAFRVLRVGGRAYFDNFDLMSDDGWSLFEDMSMLDVAVRPSNVSKASTRQELTTYMEKAGFEGVSCETGQLWVTVIGQKTSQSSVGTLDHNKPTRSV